MLQSDQGSGEPLELERDSRADALQAASEQQEHTGDSSSATQLARLNSGSSTSVHTQIHNLELDAAALHSLPYFGLPDSQGAFGTPLDPSL